MDRRSFITTIGSLSAALLAPSIASGREGNALGPGATLENVTSIYLDLSRLQPGQVLVNNNLVNSPVLYVVRRQDSFVDEFDPDDPRVSYPGTELFYIEHERGFLPSNIKTPYRSQKPEFLVVWGMCTHQGCAVSYSPPGDSWQWGKTTYSEGGFYCPCHGSTYDLAGRVFKGSPAPGNLYVPKHEFVSSTRVLVWAREQKAPNKQLQPTAKGGG